MKVLWITNTIFPAVAKELGIPIPFVGGWMYSSAKHLQQLFEGIELSVAFLYQGKTLKVMNLEGITYFLLPRSTSIHTYDKKLETYWIKIKSQVKPDIVHIHGSEYPHGLAYINACGDKNVVLSIQGLVSIYERYYYGGISEKELGENITIRDRIRQDSIFQQRIKMQRRAIFERILIKKVDHVIGRTSWDKSHTWAINPTAKYHFCNETLRSEFYQSKWEYEKCKRHSIFLSQAIYPIKGLHQIIKALPIILQHYPNTKVQVSGYDFIRLKKTWSLNGYGKYIRNTMKELSVEEKISFTGPLSQKEMCIKYLESNVFVCPSSIENSSNSIGEAQLLGVPCVASYVGGVTDIIKDKKSGLLYRFEEVEMLAEAICNIFSDIDFANMLSENGRVEAMKRHDGKKNTKTLNSIYQSICKI